MLGIVVKSTGSWYSVRTSEGERIECRIKGNFRIKDIKSTNPIAVGDNVHFTIENDNDALAQKKGIISAIEPRKNYIVRKSINLSKQTHILAANIDQAYLIATIASPRTSYGFIDRFLVTAEAYHIPVTLVFNKMDICSEAEAQEAENRCKLYSSLGYSCIKISAFREEDISQLRERMFGKINLMSGHSGVGKSTLINGIDSSLQIKTAQISDAHSKGTHTTTFAEMHELKSGGFIIDTPGIKEIGIVDIKKNELWSFFPEFRERVNQCKFNNCIHINEPGCKVKQDADNGAIALTRYNSYLSIFSGEDSNM
jgi:ribosome biogenesis GTPase